MLLFFCLTNRFQVAMCLFSNWSQMMSKYGKNKKVAQPSVSLMFFPHVDVLCDLLLNRRTATWNLFVLYNKELKKVLMMTSSICQSSNRSWVRTNQNACITLPFWVLSKLPKCFISWWTHSWHMNQLFYNIFNPMENFFLDGYVCWCHKRAQ